MMYGAENGCWYSSEHFTVDGIKIVSNWSGKFVGFLVDKKPDTNYLMLFQNDKSKTTKFEDLEITNLRFPDTPNIWQKFLNFWRL